MNLMYIFGIVTVQLLTILGFLGIYFTTRATIKAMEKDLRKKSAQIERLSRRVWVLEHRDADKSDHIVITHEASGIRYPSQEV